MPLYEYQCQACGHQTEILQKVSDKPITKCPNCQANKLVKLVSAAGFQLKGSGWYVTDFRDKDKAKTAKTTTDKKAETTSENKTESNTTVTESKKDTPKTDTSKKSTDSDKAS